MDFHQIENWLRYRIYDGDKLFDMSSIRDISKTDQYQFLKSKFGGNPTEYFGNLEVEYSIDGDPIRCFLHKDGDIIGGFDTDISSNKMSRIKKYVCDIFDSVAFKTDSLLFLEDYLLGKFFINTDNEFNQTHKCIGWFIITTLIENLPTNTNKISVGNLNIEIFGSRKFSVTLLDPITKEILGQLNRGV